MRVAATSRGVVNVAAKAVFLTVTCVACILIGFVLPMAPVLNAVIGHAFWAGALATAGALLGMRVSDTILDRIEGREPGARARAGENAATSLGKKRI